MAPTTTTNPARNNALKHGLFAESPVLPNEDPAPFEAFRNQFLKELAPATLIEEQLVCDIANLRWRLLRCQSLENAIIGDPNLTPEIQINALAKYSLYEHRLTRKFSNAFKQLQELQAVRKAQAEAQLLEAVAIAAECKAASSPFDPADYGFVFSTPEILTRLHRQERLNQAAARNRKR